MSVTINISGEGLSLEREISILQAGQIISYLGSQQSGSQVYEAQSSGPAALLSGQVDTPKKLIDNSGAKTFPEKIAVIGKYIQDRDGSEQFQLSDIRAVFTKLGTQPGNFSRDLQEASSVLRYIYLKNKKDGTYGLTDLGLEAIEKGFPENLKNTFVKKTQPGAKKVATSTIVRDEIKKMEISSVMTDFPSFHGLKTKGQKILWLLIYADAKGIKSLTPAEVDFLSVEMKGRIASSSFTALNEGNHKMGYVTKLDGKFLIQQSGIDYLKGLVIKKDEDK